jgi:hypothetical protein
VKSTGSRESRDRAIRGKDAWFSFAITFGYH